MVGIKYYLLTYLLVLDPQFLIQQGIFIKQDGNLFLFESSIGSALQSESKENSGNPHQTNHQHTPHSSLSRSPLPTPHSRTRALLTPALPTHAISTLALPNQFFKTGSPCRPLSPRSHSSPCPPEWDRATFVTLHTHHLVLLTQAARICLELAHEFYSQNPRANVCSLAKIVF